MVKHLKNSIIKEPVSFETPVAQDLSLQDYISDDASKQPNNLVENIDFKINLYKSLDILSDRERFIVLNRFGLGKRKPMTLEELGKILGFSKERIRQIEIDGIRKLKTSPQTEYLKEYLA